MNNLLIALIIIVLIFVIYFVLNKDENKDLTQSTQSEEEPTADVEIKTNTIETPKFKVLPEPVIEDKPNPTSELEKKTIQEIINDEPPKLTTTDVDYNKPPAVVEELPCSAYKDTDTNISQRCINEIWVNSGCTLPAHHTASNDFEKSKTLSWFKNDHKAWASLDTEKHRQGCYKMSQEEYNKKNKKLVGDKIVNSKYWTDVYNNLIKKLDSKTQIPPIELISIFKNQWYIDNIPTGVGSGSYGKPCNTEQVYCTYGGDKYGSGNEQLMAVIEEYNKPKIIKIKGSSYWTDIYNKLSGKYPKRPTIDEIGSSNGKWYINNIPTRIGTGGYLKPCDNKKVVCTYGKDKHGSGFQQLTAVLDYFNNNMVN